MSRTATAERKKFSSLSTTTSLEAETLFVRQPFGVKSFFNPVLKQYDDVRM